MGKWLNQLRESAKSRGDHTDKTDKNGSERVSSVLSARSGGVSKIFTPDESAASVSFVGSPYEPFQDSRAFNDWHGWDEEDWQSAFDERAAILEFDQGMSREEAELLAGRQLEAERKRWMQ
jgi:hypothetical protein